MTVQPKVTTTETDPNRPKAKRHKLLAMIDAELRGCHVQEPVFLYGHEYVLKTLDPTEESWADAYVSGDNFYQTARNQRYPYIAAALVSIDGVPVEELFEVPGIEEPSEGDAEEGDKLARELLGNEQVQRAWRRLEVLKWLIDQKHDDLVQKLWDHFLKLDGERKEALNLLDPLSKKNRTGVSSSTSSPERESSSAIPASGE